MNINRIFLNQEFNTQKDVFDFLGKQMQEIGIVDEAQIYIDALISRENQSTTGLVDGFSIPHGKSENIKDSAVIYVRNNKGIEWNSLDGSLITDIFALAIPAIGEDSHLDSLIAISTQLMDASICQQLRQTEEEKEICSIFK